MHWSVIIFKGPFAFDVTREFWGVGGGGGGATFKMA